MSLPAAENAVMPGKIPETPGPALASHGNFTLQFVRAVGLRLKFRSNRYQIALYIAGNALLNIANKPISGPAIAGLFIYSEKYLGKDFHSLLVPRTGMGVYSESTFWSLGPG